MDRRDVVRALAALPALPVLPLSAYPGELPEVKELPNPFTFADCS